jgi:hypothetical protein
LGTAGSIGFEFGETTQVVDNSDPQTLTTLTLTASQRDMTKTAGDAQSQVFSTELATALEVTVVDDLGDAVVGLTPTATGSGTITAFSATDSTGKSTATWTLGSAVGAQTMTVALAGYPDAVFTATATTGPLASYAIVFDSFASAAGAGNDITITAKDAGGNTITGHTGIVTITATDSAATLPAPYTFVAGDSGVKTLNVILKTAGEQTVTATTDSVTASVSGTVVPAAASKIVLTASATTVASGGVGTSTLTATIQDAFENTVAAESGVVSYAVTGADTTNAGWTSETATLASGVATKDFTTQGVVASPGSVVVTVTATKGALTAGTIDLTIVNFSVTPAASNARIGDTITLSVEGAQGTVSWVVAGDAGVGTLGSFSGTNSETAVFTVAKAGNATITVTEAGKTSVATVAAYNDVAITDKPDTVVTVKPGADSAEFSVSGGDASYTWSVTGPSSVPPASGSTYKFTAPSTGSFAGEYTIAVTDSISTNSETFKVYVPLVIEPTTTLISIMSNASAQPFTLTGAVDPTPYTATVDSFDDDLTYTPVTAVFSGNTASYAFDPSDYSVTTETKEYSLDFAVQGLTDPSTVTMSIVPVLTKNFAGTIVDADGDPVSGVTVTITSPANFTSQAPQITDVLGEFTFSGLVVLKESVLGFKAQKTQYVPKTFTSDALASPIKLADAGASISGTTNATAKVTLFNAAGTVAGPMDTAAGGAFKFEFAVASASSVDYTITASATGKYGDATFTADSATYTPVVNIVLAAIANPGALTGSTAVNASAPQEFTSVVGGKTLKLVISPVLGGGVVEIAPPVATDITDTTAPIKSGVKWEIDGLGKGHPVTLLVPCSLADAIAVANGIKGVKPAKAVRFKNSGSTSTWQVAEVDLSKINYDGDNSSIEAVIRDWSSNIVGIGAAASAAGQSDDSSDCFIGSLSASGSPGSMVAWIFIAIILAAGIVLRTNKKRKLN